MTEKAKTKKNMFIWVRLESKSNDGYGLTSIRSWYADCVYDNIMSKKAKKGILKEIENSMTDMDKKGILSIGSRNIDKPKSHEECIKGRWDGSEDIIREIEGIVIRSHSNKDDFKTGLNFKEPHRIENKVDFPTSNKEDVIIGYKDKCSYCGEYLDESYNVVYKYGEVHLALNKGEYNGEIYSIEILTNKDKIADMNLNPTQDYVHIELGNQNAYITKDTKIPI